MVEWNGSPDPPKLRTQMKMCRVNRISITRGGGVLFFNSSGRERLVYWSVCDVHKYYSMFLEEEGNPFRESAGTYRKLPQGGGLEEEATIPGSGSTGHFLDEKKTENTHTHSCHLASPLLSSRTTVPHTHYLTSHCARHQRWPAVMFRGTGLLYTGIPMYEVSSRFYSFKT